MLQSPICTDPHFKFDLRGPVRMKGKADPMITYILSSQKIDETDL